MDSFFILIPILASFATGLAGFFLALRVRGRLRASGDGEESSAEARSIAALQERERIAREMHDGPAQAIGLLGIKVRVVQGLVRSGRLQEANLELEQMHRIAQDAYSDVRNSMLDLRTAARPPGGFVRAIQDCAAAFSHWTGVPVDLALPEALEASLPAETEVQAVRIVQEALANVRKHARASDVRVSLEERAGEIVLAVEDDGAGFDPSADRERGNLSFGVRTMRERAEAVGAVLELISRPGEGTIVRVRVPLQRAPGEGKGSRAGIAS